jgi:hypothetical protein
MKNAHNLLLLSFIFSIVISMMLLKEELNLKFHQEKSGLQSNIEKNNTVRLQNALLFKNFEPNASKADRYNKKQKTKLNKPEIIDSKEDSKNLDEKTIQEECE